MENRVLIRFGPKPHAANALPKRCSRWNLITIGYLVSEIFVIFESVDPRTGGRTPTWVPSYKLMPNLWLLLAKKIHQVIYSLSSISWPCLKILAVIVFEISWLQVFNAKNLQRAITQKHNFFFNFHQIMYSLSTITWPSLKLIAIIVFEISNFLCPNLQRAITQKIK